MEPNHDPPCLACSYALEPGHPLVAWNPCTPKGNPMNAAEEWRHVPDYRGAYLVSSRGRVASLMGKGFDIMSPATDHSGYLYVNLRGHRPSKRFYVHRLVALAFHGRSEDPVVRHIDGDKLNNTPDNVAFGTVLENNRDIIRHGHNVNANKTSCKHGHVFTAQNTRVYDGRRFCRTCEAIRSRARRAREREAGK